jgi:1-acyl-sn-glycerol-3-phosphate acyltransferase
MTSSQFRLLRERRFAPFFWTQFFGAFNDNVLKNALVIIVTYQAARFAGANSSLAGLQSGILVNLAAGLFILPFFLLSASAGQIADRMEKASLIRIIKGAEIGVMLLAAYGFVASNLAALLGALFLMGVHSTFFGPVKYAILPQNLAETELIGGNALIESGTFIAILAGTITGGYLASLGGVGPEAAAAGGVLVALLGFCASWFVPRSPAAAPDLAIDWNPLRETWRNFRFIRRNVVVFRAILGISWFWLYGALLLSQFPQYTKEVLRGGETSVTALLAIFSVGVGAGSLLCERLSGHKIELGLVPFGSIGLTAFGVDFFFASQALGDSTVPTVAALFQDWAHLRVVADLLLTGAFGGFYIVPLYALMQSRTERAHVSRAVAGNNVLNALFMVIGALAAIGLIRAGCSVNQILLIGAIANAAVALYIYTLVPEFLMRFMVWMLIHSVYRLRKIGIERIPEEGPAILVCNHVSYVDAMVISAACPRPIRWVMDHHIFRMPLLHFFFRTLRAIPIAPAKEDPAMLERAYARIGEELAAGELVGLFPEGKLTSDGNMDEFRGGIMKALQKAPVPVVPMALSGLWRSLFARNRDKLRHLRRLFPRIRLAVGAPVPAAAVTPEALRAAVAELRGPWK